MGDDLSNFLNFHMGKMFVGLAGVEETPYLVLPYAQS